MVSLKEYSSEKYRGYFKFLFVRNPYDRLVSGYKQKIRYGMLDKIVKYIILKYRNDTSRMNNSQESGPPTFNEFMHYIADKINQFLPIDPHFDKYGNYRTPCIIDFDFIGKYESLKEDSAIVLEKLFPNKSTKLPEKNVMRSNKTFIDFFREVDQKYIETIAKYNADEFALYGYDPTILLW